MQPAPRACEAHCHIVLLTALPIYQDSGLKCQKLRFLKCQLTSFNFSSRIAHVKGPKSYYVNEMEVGSKFCLFRSYVTKCIDALTIENLRLDSPFHKMQTRSSKFPAQILH
jgi:hypothetical protein